MDIFHTFALFGSFFFGFAAVVIFLLLCFYSDIAENGFAATFFLIVFGLLFYFWGKESWDLFVSLLTLQNLIIYFSVGLIHSFVRIFFYGREEMRKVNRNRLEERYEYTINRDVKEHVFRWWFLWPFSLINWFIKDMIKDIFNGFYKMMNKVFNSILNLGIKSVPEVPQPESKRKGKI